MGVVLHAVPSPADAIDLVRDDLEVVCDESDGALTLGCIVERILAGEAQLWLVLDETDYVGCYVTEPVEGGRFLHVVAARIRPGSDAFEPSIRRLGDFAHSWGARLSATSRRPGMARLLGRLGWEPRFTEYVEPEGAA